MAFLVSEMKNIYNNKNKHNFASIQPISKKILASNRKSKILSMQISDDVIIQYGRQKSNMAANYMGVYIIFQ